MTNEQIQTPLVSIIVITFNSSKYIIETLDSAKAQTYQEVELIISDDNSTDNTIDICEEWLSIHGERFRNIEIVKASINSGIAGNCNRGIKAANGKWIKIIAGDDILKKDCLYLNISYALKHNCLITFSRVIFFKNVDGKLVKISEAPNEEQIRKFSFSSIRQYKELLLENFIWVAPSSFIKRNVFELTGGFDEQFPMMEDYPMWIKLTNSGVKLHYFDEPTIYYRQEESVTRSSKWMNEKYYFSLKKHYYLIIDKNLPFSSRFKRRAFFFKYLILINFFGNKKNLVSKGFTKMYDYLIKTEL